jgi:alkyl sulfatase BDS1-like metallo-beta-lactamase superfamily hydrolase
MSARMGETLPQPDATITGPRQLLLGLLYARMPMAAMEQAGLKIEGDKAAVQALQMALEPSGMAFPVVTP